MANNIEQIASKLFDNHSEQTAVHFTSDGAPFFNKHNAEAHAKTLPDDKVVTIEKDGSADSKSAKGKTDKK